MSPWVNVGQIDLPTEGQLNAAIEAVKGEPGGIAPLDGSGRLPDDVLPQRLGETEIAATIDAVVAPLLGSAGLVIIEHGGNAAAPRQNASGETFTGPALWVGTVPPANRITGDFYYEVSTVPLPLVIWSESIPVDGPLGNTEVGGLPWQVFGTGYAGAKSGGRLVFTSGTTSLGAMIVDDGQTDVTFRAQIAARGTTYSAGIIIRWVDINNHLVLARNSASDATYRLSRRSGGTYTHLSVLTGRVMTDGDQFEITTLASGALVIKLNGVEIYNGTVTEQAGSTARGVYCLLPGEATTVAYDNLSVSTVV